MQKLERKRGSRGDRVFEIASFTYFFRQPIGQIDSRWIRELMLATRIRLTKQRFVRGLRRLVDRLVDRARATLRYREMAEDFHDELALGGTWRQLARDMHRAQTTYGEYNTSIVRYLMDATQLRLTTQRFLAGLRRLVDRRRNLRRRLQ